MDTLRGGTSPESFPDYVRQDLMDVERLRAIWAEHRRSQPRHVRRAARAALAQRCAEELGGGAALAELVDSTTAEGLSGHPLTVGFVQELAHRCADLPDDCAARSPRRPLERAHAERLTAAAADPSHPVVRAAHTYGECVAVLTELESADTEGPSGPRPWALPWVLASLVLQRADLPPLLLAAQTPPAAQAPESSPEDLVHHFARLVTHTLRVELSWAPQETAALRDAASPPPLAAATQRRVSQYVRSCRDSVALILRALDPHSRTSVHSGGTDDPAGEDSRATSAARSVLTPGGAHWWTSLELVTGEVSLSLFVVVQEIGRPSTGVLAVTVDAHLATADGVRDALVMPDSESVTVMPADCADDRWPQIRVLLDEAVSRSMDELTRA